jgi:hypothetical protein
MNLESNQKRGYDRDNPTKKKKTEPITKLKA